MTLAHHIQEIQRLMRLRYGANGDSDCRSCVAGDVAMLLRHKAAVLHRFLQLTAVVVGNRVDNALPDGEEQAIAVINGLEDLASEVLLGIAYLEEDLNAASSPKHDAEDVVVAALRKHAAKKGPVSS